MSLKQAEGGTSAKTTPPTTAPSQHDPVTGSPPAGTSDGSPSVSYGPANIFEQDGREYLRHESKVVANKIFIFEATRKLNDVRRFRCRDCYKVAHIRGGPIPPGMIRPVHVRDGMMVTDPEKPSGVKHICLRETLGHTSSRGTEQTSIKATGRRGRSATRASSDTAQTSKSALLKDGTTSEKATIEEGQPDGSLKTGVVAADVTAGSTVRKGRTMLRATSSVPFSLKANITKARVTSKKAKATSVAQAGAAEADATEVEASDKPATANKRRVIDAPAADDNRPQVNNNQEGLGSDAAAFEPALAKKRRVYESEPRDNPLQGDGTHEDPRSDAVGTQDEATGDQPSSEDLGVDQEPSVNDSHTHVENDYNDGRAVSPDFDLHLSEPPTPARTAAEDHEDVVQEDDAVSSVDETLGTLLTPKQEIVEDSGEDRLSSASQFNFDGFPAAVLLTKEEVKQIYYVGNVPLLKRNGLPHRIYFAGPPLDVLIDNQVITLAFGETKKVEIDGETHAIRFGGPTKELLIGDVGIAGYFCGRAFVATIGGKQRVIRLCDETPVLVAETNPAHEFVPHANIAPKGAVAATEDTPQGPSNLREHLKLHSAALHEEVQASASHADTTDTCSPPAATPPSDESPPAVSVAIASAAFSGPSQTNFAPHFGPAIFDNDRSVVHYENIFGGTYAFSLVEERQVSKDGKTHLVRAYRCQDCMDVANRRHPKRDVPLVKTVDDEFVDRDPDCPLGNVHLCAPPN